MTIEEFSQNMEKMLLDIQSLLLQKNKSFREEHFPNDSCPNQTTLEGMKIEVSFLRPKNDLRAIPVTLLGITVLLLPTHRVFVSFQMSALQSSRESKYGFPSLTRISSKDSQKSKAPWIPNEEVWIYCSVDGKSMETRFLQET